MSSSGYCRINLNTTPMSRDPYTNDINLLTTKHPGPANISMFMIRRLKTNQSQLKADSNNKIGIKMNRMMCGCIPPMIWVLTPRNPMFYWSRPNTMPAESTMGLYGNLVFLLTSLKIRPSSIPMNRKVFVPSVR